MADSRINLLTSALTTANDDFFVVDGNTNGTRKLSAFNPTIGGDPTITGTLTVNGTSLSNALVVNGNGLALNTAGSASVRFQDSGTSKWWIYKLSGDQNLYIRDMVNSRMQMTFIPGLTSGNAISYLFSNLVVDSTAASTTTATGAVVIGGGLGVGGAIFAGGNIQCNAVYASNNTTLYLRPQGATVSSGEAQLTTTGNLTLAGTLTASGTGDSSFAGILRVNNGAIVASGASAPASGSGVELQHAGTIGRILAYNRTASSPQELTINHAGGNVTIGGTGTVTSILGTTASTSTSSGALVVSGGVGVAGAIVTGGIIRCGGSNGLSLGSDTGNIRIDSAGPAGVEFRGLSAADTITGFTMREMALIDGTTAPSTRAGYATIYVDSADGDLKVKFGDGTVKTIATDS